MKFATDNTKMTAFDDVSKLVLEEILEPVSDENPAATVNVALQAAFDEALVRGWGEASAVYAVAKYFHQLGQKNPLTPS